MRLRLLLVVMVWIVSSGATQTSIMACDKSKQARCDSSRRELGLKAGSVERLSGRKGYENACKSELNMCKAYRPTCVSDCKGCSGFCVGCGVCKPPSV